ncbi:1,4-alpha-glucan branching protein domain-containing protein [Alkalihalobacillus sp. AL-G]|uniref:1,4-alpha-glucan branching protein domain-containing protein n=1 Tax=Alkalihalobacillus sp. AL-G TaxID=2926399 RepID=UPI00272C88D1|nr:1,4-alpha-glucan branching protein domain-containing protein [Alkalihalobacillus sp. AL-G]WLD92073.1 DUF1957 domain-containing protein [Alkalihalobacillus sp. AL-G]
MNGFFALVLHAHLPYVLHEKSGRLEERWLFEAISESYIPLIWGLENKSSNACYTLSLSPPLLEMLADERVKDRFLDYINNTLELIDKELKYVSNRDELENVRFYQNRYKRIKQTFLEWNGNLITAFRSYALQNKLECITSSATHAFLPYIQTEQGLRLQIQLGIRCFERHFGFKPDGFWLPECAFTPGVDKVLYEEGIRYTFVDEGTIHSLDPKPENSVIPVFSPHGIVLFPRHSEVSRKVWDAEAGYPGDGNYREFYRDIGYIREFDYIKNHIHPDGIRVDTGLKYHRVTGDTEKKDWYVRKSALNRVSEHSKDFIGVIGQSLQDDNNENDAPPITLASFDAELFGHWWFEGPEWITALLENSESTLSWITPKEFLRRYYHSLDTHHACFSSWGRDGFGDVWLNEANAWIYRHLHEMERELLKYFAIESNEDQLTKATLDQMAREWMLAASSDWTFIIDQQSSAEYAIRRLKDHIAAFNFLKKALDEKTVTSSLLEEVRSRYSFLQWCHVPELTSEHDKFIRSSQSTQAAGQDKLTILMLAWEFPPNVVGGLARHVYDLSREFVQQEHNVYVITNAVEGYPDYEIMDGVHVYRTKCDQPQHENFFHWTGSLNFAIAGLGLKLAERIQFDCIHAHDWIVSVSAKSLQQQLNIPLIATIHATEHGRNNGIHSDLQEAIHHKEWELMFEAQHIIVCSSYMKQEIRELFHIPENKIAVIPNGVDPSLISVSAKSDNWMERYGGQNNFYVFSLGRVVREKGFNLLIEAASSLKESHPAIKFIIAGKGPMLDQYRSDVKERDLEGSVFFIGFVTDEERNRFLAEANAVIFPSLYEPFGIVALEAMVAKTPVIVSDTGGMGNLIDHHENGLKVYTGNPESIRDQIIDLFENPELCRSLVTNAWDDVTRKYSWNLIALETISVFNQYAKKLNVVREEFV